MLRSYALGVCCILAVALIWSASSVLVQAIFVSANFSRPFFLTWVANSLFAVTLPLRAVTLFVARVARRWRNRRWSDRDPDAAIAALSEEPAPAAVHTLRSGSIRRAARSGLLVAPVWFAANFTYNLSMSMTSITSSTVISSSSAAFTLLLSVIWLRERVTALKLLGIALCWLGNGLTAIGDDAGGSLPPSNTTNTTGGGGSGTTPFPFLGDAICLLSACLYACYTVLIRKLSPTDLSLFFGFLGLSTFFLFGPRERAFTFTFTPHLHTSLRHLQAQHTSHHPTLTPPPSLPSPLYQARLCQSYTPPAWRTSPHSTRKLAASSSQRASSTMCSPTTYGPRRCC